MARKKKKSPIKTGSFTSKYDIPAIIMEYVHELMPDPDDPAFLENTAEENLLFFENMAGLCISIWNYAALPADCAASYLTDLRKGMEAEKGKVICDSVITVMLKVSKDMKKNFPNPDAVITDHEFIMTEDDQLDFVIELLRIEEAVALARENK